jgi:hexokinase
VYPHLVAWEGVGEDTKKSYSACVREIPQNSSRIKNATQNAHNLMLASVRTAANIYVIILYRVSVPLQEGLSSTGHPTSSVKCFPTYVRRLPNGNEVGKFLSLDLGGTNFRVIVMEITEDREFLMDSKIYSVPEDIMTGEEGEEMRNTTFRSFFFAAILCL